MDGFPRRPVGKCKGRGPPVPGKLEVERDVGPGLTGALVRSPDEFLFQSPPPYRPGDRESVRTKVVARPWELQEQAESCNCILVKDLCLGGVGTAADWECAGGADCQRMSRTDSRLARLCETWPSLPEHVILAILALVDSSPVAEARRLQPPS